MAKQDVVGIYTRVSTVDRQDTKAQENELRAFAEKRGWTIYRVYSDRGESGAKEKRPALDELWRDCRQGRCAIICVWSDRLARSLKQLIESLEEFRRLKIDFVSFKQDFDTTSPAGRLLFHVVGAVARIRARLNPRTSLGWHGPGTSRRKALRASQFEKVRCGGRGTNSFDAE